MKELICQLCGHKWTPRTQKEPKACPNCKRYDWKEGLKPAENTTNI